MKNRFNYIMLIILILGIVNAVAQNNEIESLKLILNKSKEDTNKIFILNKIARQYFLIGEYDSSIYYAEKIKYTSEKILKSDKENTPVFIACQKGIGMFHNVMGLNQYSMGDYKNATVNYNSYLTISEKINDKKGIAAANGNIGNMYYEQGRYPEALDLYLLTLKIREDINDEKGLANSYLSLGNVYGMLNNSWASLKYYKKALMLFQRFDDRYSIAGTYSNIAGIYSAQGFKYLALKMYKEYLKLMIDFNDQQSIAVTLGNIGYIYNDQNRNTEALKMFNEALKIQEQINDIPGSASSYLSLGESYLKMLDYKQAESYFLKGFMLAKQLKELELLRQSYAGLYSLYKETKQYKKSLYYFKSYIIYRDSINSKENTEKATRIELNFEYEKKQAAANVLKLKRQAEVDSERKKQQIIIWSISAILFLVICFSVFIYRIYLQKQKANIQLEHQKYIIEEKQKEILDSIHYAKRIQTALITSERYISKTLIKLNRND